MKFKLGTLILLLFTFFGSCRHNIGGKTFDDYSKEIKKTSDRTSDPKNFLNDCKYETDHQITFPRDTPVYAILHANHFFGSQHKLTNEQLHALLSLLNDTSTYMWGEPDMPHFDNFITFHNKIGTCIAITEISYDGQTRSNPNLAKMKYGALSLKGLSTILTLLQNKTH